MNKQEEVKERKTQKIVRIVIFVLMIGVAITIYGAMGKTLNEEVVCYEPICSKTTLDQFENCKDIGIESTGFLSSAHYYLCDGDKVGKSCLEVEWIISNRTINPMSMVSMRCEPK